MIGALQWAVSIGHIDITTAVMTLSNLAKRIYGYLSKMRHGMIRIRTEEPDYSALPEITYDWAYSVYGNVKELISSRIFLTGEYSSFSALF